MKRYFLLFGSAFLLFFAGLVSAQEKPTGVWSVAISSGFNYSVSSSMHGDIGQYEEALKSVTTSAQYPFALNRSFGGGLGANAEYRFAKSPLSLYVGAYGSSFNAGNGFRNSSGGRFTMTILSLAAGIEYTFGQTYQTWNFYGRIGIVPTTINTSNRTGNGNRFSFDSLRINATEARTGLEIEVGERYHFHRLPFGIEASVNYTNANLIGKSYSAPVYQTGFFGRGQNGSINDGKNPNDTSDNPRTIDYLSLRVGVRFYF